MAPKLLFDIDAIDLSRVEYSLDEIRAVNAQRFEFEQLTAVIALCPEREFILGLREVSPGEFWTRGHMPDKPLFPGVLMIEAAAQLCAFYSRKIFPREGFYGLAGVDKVRFRQAITPACRLYLLARPRVMTPTRSVFATQGVVDGRVAFEASVFGLRMQLPNN